MRSGANNLNYFPQNKQTKLANFVQFRRMLMFCLEDWGAGPSETPPPCLRHWSTNDLKLLWIVVNV